MFDIPRRFPLRPLIRHCTTLAFAVLLSVSASALFAQEETAEAPSTGTCLLFTAKNISKGGSNFFLQVGFSKKTLTVAAGDTLQYDLLVDSTAPEPAARIEVVTRSPSINPSTLR